MRGLWRFLATLGPVGYAPFAPATVGSAVVALAAWYIPAPALAETLALLAVATVIAAWIAGEAEKDLGKDAKPIVVDEAVGQCLALLFLPHTVVAYVTAFLLFRVFDVWKPLGANDVQKWPGGAGIVADDVIAGLTACATYHIGAWALRSLGWVA